MKKLLLVVDFQKDFVSGSLGFDGAEKLDGAISQKITDYRNAGYHIGFTFDTHGEDYLNTKEGEGIPVPHCIKDSDGWQLFGKVATLKQPTDKTFIKYTFGSDELLSYLQTGKYDEVEVVGLVSNICVLSNVVVAQTALPNAKITVDACCTGSYSADLNEKTFDVMEGLLVNVINRNKDL